MRLALLALALAACAHAPAAPPRWTVRGGSPEAQATALGLVDSAARIYPALPKGGVVHLLPSLDQGCWRAQPPAVVTGCPVQGGVLILWPHPKCPPPADLTCSALAHELAHVAGAGTEAAADAGAALVVQAWRKAQP